VGIIYDTTVLIKVERNDIDLASLLSGRRDGPFGISVVSIAELLHGAHRADTEKRRASRVAFVEKLCKQMTIFDYDTAAAKVFAEISSDTAQKGGSVGINDLIIAATAISHGHCVMTINKKDFENIAGLQLEALPSRI